MSLSTNTTYRIYVEKLGATDPTEFIGNQGEIFYDPFDPELKLSDGSTPGGVTLGSSPVVGHLYVVGNATNTTFPAASDNVWTKVAGTTTVGDFNVGFTHTNNRLTCTSTTTDLYLVTAGIYFEGVGGTYDAQFSFYDSNVGIRTSATVTHEASNGIINHVTLTDVVQLNQNDYVEVHVKNTADDTSIHISDMNLILTKI
jgi:hypothetical protein